MNCRGNFIGIKADLADTYNVNLTQLGVFSLT